MQNGANPTIHSNERQKILQNAIEQHQAGRLCRARESYKRILRSDPTHPKARHNLGILILQEGNPETAVSHLRAALEEAPGKAQHWISLVDALIKVGDLEEAQKTLERGRSQGLEGEAVENAGVRLQQARTDAIVALFGAERYEEAQLAARNYVSDYPAHFFGYKALGTTLCQTGRPEEALSALDEALAIKTDPQTFHAQGKAFQDLGRAEEALKSYNKALELNPDYAEARNKKGTVLEILGREREALTEYERAMEIEPGLAEAHYNAGNAARKLGKFEKALKQYDRALEMRSDYPEVYLGKANLLQERGHLNQALESIEKLTGIKPDYLDAWIHMGNLLQDIGRPADALESYERAAEIAPDFAETHRVIGHLLCELGKPDHALPSYQKCCEIDPQCAVAHADLADALRQLGQPRKALEEYEKATQLDPDFARAHNGAAEVLKDLGQFDNALKRCQLALNIDPDFISALNNKGSILKQQRDFEQSVAVYREAIEKDPSRAATYNNLGNVLMSLGRKEQAHEAFNRALEIEPDFAQAYYNLLELPGVTLTQDQMKRLEGITEDAATSREEKLVAHFALGKILAREGKYDEAFNNYKRGHEHRSALSWQEDDHSVLRHLAFNVLSRDYFADRKQWGSASQKPIFIVGFPRSGTSLVEQILASHSMVYGAGELHDMTRAMNRICDLDNPKTTEKRVTQFSRHQVREWANQYLNRLLSRSEGEPRVTDKMPHNFLHLWFISLLFPKATVLHCVRNPLDTCVSCFSRNFSWGHHCYTDNLTALGKHYGLYRKLMSRWKQILPVTIHEVTYERLATDPGKQIRGIVNLCELPFEKSCLEFYRTNRPVNTASATQVKQKVYTSSVGKWRNYARHLKPLIEALEETGVSHEADVPYSESEHKNKCTQRN